jgi:hypothetical protein
MDLAIRRNAMRHALQRLADTRPERAQSAFNFELRSVRAAHDAIARRVEVFVTAPRHRGAFMWTGVAVYPDAMAAPNCEHGVRPESSEIEPSRLAVGEILESAQEDAHQASTARAVFAGSRLAAS